MNKKSLWKIYHDHQDKVSDKWSLYLTEYERIFADFQDKPISIFEIGIQNGGSLEIYGKYFSNYSYSILELAIISQDHSWFF